MPAPIAALPTSVLALVTMVHVGLLVLRQHRIPPGVFPWAVIPALVLSAAPWVFPSATGVLAGLAAHVCWFVACERLIPVPASRAASAPPPRQAADTRPAGSRVTTAAVEPKRSRDFLPFAVLAIVDESPAVRTFRIARPASFSFQAGQFLTLRVMVDGVPHVRCYSISSAPEAAGYLEISVKRQGLVSGTLHATMRQGGLLWVKPPAGRFVYPSADDRPLALIAGGIGITPLMSMVRHAVAADPLRPLTLVYSARTPQELVFGDELAWLAKRHPQLRVAATITGDCQGWSGHRGRLTEAVLAHHIPDAAHSIFMLCGPGDMVRDVRAILTAAGLAESQIRFEVFQPATAIGAAAPAMDEPATRPTLELVRSERAVTVTHGESLLDAADRAGAPIPSLCRSGVCGTCRTRLVSGDARCDSDGLEPRDRQAGYVLPCVTWAQGDCKLEA